MVETDILCNGVTRSKPDLAVLGLTFVDLKLQSCTCLCLQSWDEGVHHHLAAAVVL